MRVLPSVPHPNQGLPGLLGALLYLEGSVLGLGVAGCDKREGRSTRGNSLCKGWETGKGLVSWRKLRG